MTRLSRKAVVAVGGADRNAAAATAVAAVAGSAHASRFLTDA